MSDRPYLVLVGGFLGAGKTTLILAAARALAKRGLRSAAIMNDQGDDLVDTQFARAAGIETLDVTGGCFCCRFPELVERAHELRAHTPDVIFAEPVGSCTDISATTLAPLRREYAADFRLAPFTVLVDPERALQLLAPGAEENLSFLFRTQLEEADLVCSTKSDLHPSVPESLGRGARQLSAKTGQGVEAWIDEVLEGGLSAGLRTLEIDYEQYARAEAALAWLNLSVTFEPESPLSGAMVIGPLLDAIEARMTGADISIVHLKASAQSDAGFLKASICSGPPQIEGNLDASPSARHEVRVNLRAIGEPEAVREIVESEVGRMRGTVTGLRVACFRPTPPKPWYQGEQASRVSP